MKTEQLKFLRFLVEPDTGAGGGETTDTDTADDITEVKHGEVTDTDTDSFPADTPVKDMTPLQQAAYWKFQARKHENRARPKNFDEIVEKAAKFDELAKQQMSDSERAIAEAKAAAFAEGRAALAPSVIRAELRAELPHLSARQLDELLENVAVEKFVTDDGVDVERVRRFAEPLKQTTETGNLFGNVMSKTRERKESAGDSIATYRERELQRYKAK